LDLNHIQKIWGKGSIGLVSVASLIISLFCEYAAFRTLPSPLVFEIMASVAAIGYTVRCLCIRWLADAPGARLPYVPTHPGVRVPVEKSSKVGELCGERWVID